MPQTDTPLTRPEVEKLMKLSSTVVPPQYAPLFETLFGAIRKLGKYVLALESKVREMEKRK